MVTHKVWGHFDASCVNSTLFVETEDPAWMVEARIRGLAKGLGIQEDDRVPGFHYVCVGPFDILDEEQRLRSLIVEYSPDFMVLSTLQNLLFDRDWKNQSDMQPIMALVLRLAQGCPLFLVTHSPWDKRQKRAAGSVTQAANFLTAMHYEKQLSRKSDATFVHVSVDSKAGALDTDFSLKLETTGDAGDPGSVRRILYSGTGWPKGLVKDAAMAEMARDPDASSKEIAERVHCDIRYVQKIAKELSGGKA